MKILPCVDCLVFVSCKSRVLLPTAPLGLYQKVEDLVLKCKILKDHFLEHSSTEKRYGIKAVIWREHRLVNEVICVFDLDRREKRSDGLITYFD
jgi:hypothetical protein